MKPPAFVLACALGLAACQSGSRHAAASAPRSPAMSADDAADRAARMADYFPNTPLVTHRGQPVRFHDDLVRGRTVLIQFMYTQCDGT